jgi:peptide/nickel transport system ATP-binding protein/oligopeptide transport system ATP-binding protein
MGQVGIADAKRRLANYPHEFSGGMRQRAMIAIALAAEPLLLLADEPTTALDVTIQDQILKLLAGLVSKLGMAFVLVTHDLGVVAAVCERVCVMYAGRIVEDGPVDDVFTEPRHAYTHALLRSVPGNGPVLIPLESIPGQPPRLDTMVKGCAFTPRCRFVQERCHSEEPRLSEVSPGHRAACWSADRLALPRAGV